ncbi:transmembrane protein, putative (macronuclear) [Tetrahymena thermophila SB210]|uniref:Transmembrane protein, putative n=1 Tax=Tetrahymena thermophila (strain SB210) TaxID=312017 RepID=Q23JM2_TETTS|nr:transmembrane protein, putative [Tetrahymena thermophila SB210]EAR96721.1 transmembrane protein, putative [Tetrahymena thermophila SB210]|eukprot:XP_001016966.1 transmembrane protein, putative [Tetrahymena thermophila SB210]
MQDPLNGVSDRQAVRNKCLHAIDIFAFLPVPKTEEVSTKRSVIGSLSLIVIFLGYLIFSLISFFTNNAPRINQYSVPLDYNLVINNPDLAIGFLSGKELNDFRYNNDTSYFEIVGKRKIKYYDVDTQGFTEASRDLYLQLEDPDWISQNFTILTPYYEKGDDLQMQGLLYTSQIHQFPSFTLYTCRNTTQKVCASQDAINQLFAGGRLFTYFKKKPSVNYASGKSVDTSDNQFYQFYFFIVPGLYNRAEIVYQYGEVDRYPDYATRFTHEKSNTLEIVNQYNYVSDVAPNDQVTDPSTSGKMPSQYAFQVWTRLAEDVVQNEVVYDTIMDKVSSWGAFWGVLFSAFAIYFLRYNKERFYKKNPDWDQFDRKIDKFDIVSENGMEENDQQLSHNQVQIQNSNHDRSGTNNSQQQNNRQSYEA